MASVLMTSAQNGHLFICPSASWSRTFAARLVRCSSPITNPTTGEKKKLQKNPHPKLKPLCFQNQATSKQGTSQTRRNSGSRRPNMVDAPDCGVVDRRNALGVTLWMVVYLSNALMGGLLHRRVTSHREATRTLHEGPRTQ